MENEEKNDWDKNEIWENKEAECAMKEDDKERRKERRNEQDE